MREYDREPSSEQLGKAYAEFMDAVQSDAAAHERLMARLESVEAEAARPAGRRPGRAVIRRCAAAAACAAILLISLAILPRLSPKTVLSPSSLSAASGNGTQPSIGASGSDDESGLDGAAPPTGGGEGESNSPDGDPESGRSAALTGGNAGAPRPASSQGAGTSLKAAQSSAASGAPQATANAGKDVSLDEAKADPLFGQYLPDGLAALCGAEEPMAARATAEALSLQYSGSAGEIRWQIERMTDGHQALLIDMNRAGDVQNAFPAAPLPDGAAELSHKLAACPIFRAEQLTESLVARRENLPAGNTGRYLSFGVCFGDVVVLVTSRSIAPPEIYGLFRQLL